MLFPILQLVWSKNQQKQSYIKIFGKDMPEPPYVKELSLNYCKKKSPS